MAERDESESLSYETPGTRQEMSRRIPDGYLGHRAKEVSEEGDAPFGDVSLTSLVTWVVAFLLLLTGLLWYLAAGLKTHGV